MLGHDVSVVATHGYKLIMFSLFNDATIDQNQNEIGVANRAKSMSDNDTGAGELAQIVVHDGFCYHVQMAGGLVEQQKRGRTGESARKTQALALAARQTAAALDDSGFVAHGHSHDIVMDRRDLRCSDNPLKRQGGIAEADVLPDGSTEQDRILQNDAELTSQRAIVQVS